MLFFLLLGIVERRFLSTHKSVLSYEIQANDYDTLEVFYDDGRGFHADQKEIVVLKGGGAFQHVVFPELRVEGLRKIRLDFGNINDSVYVRNVRLTSANGTINVLEDKDLLSDNCMNVVSKEGQLVFERTCQDPYIVYNGQLNALVLTQYSSADWWRLGIFLFTYIICLIFIWLKQPGVKRIEQLQTPHLAFAVCFGVFISCHWYSTIAGFEGVDFTVEKRSPEPFPEFGESGFMKDAETWFEDHMSIRQQLMYGQSHIKYDLFAKSALPEKVIVGKNKEMFPSQEGILDDFLGNKLLNVPQLMSMRQSVIERINYLKKQGIDYYLFFAPNKHTIYPQDMPEKHFKRYNKDSTSLSQLIRFFALDSIIQAHLCDSRKGIRSAARNADKRLYCKNDLHWNGHGAYVGYEFLFNKMGERHPNLKAYPQSAFVVKRRTDKNGDLARMLMIHSDEEREIFEYTLRDRNAPNYIMKPIYGEDLFPQYHTVSTNKKLPRAVIFRDSFAQDMIQFVSLHFSDALYVWNQNFNDELITERKPDIVIQEITEMFIYDLLRVNSKKVKEIGREH